MEPRYNQRLYLGSIFVFYIIQISHYNKIVNWQRPMYIEITIAGGKTYEN